MADDQPARMSPEVCFGSCTSSGPFDYFGMEDGYRCLCGNSIGPWGPSESSSCNATCPGDSRSACGSATSISVYAAEHPFSSAGNAAFAKNVTASSASYDARFANDGRLDTYFVSYGIDRHDYIDVDLGDGYYIESVVLYGHRPYMAGFSPSFYVMVSLDPLPDGPAGAVIRDHEGQIGWYQQFSGTDFFATRFETPVEGPGRFVRVQLNASTPEPLVLAEFVVTGYSYNTYVTPLRVVERAVSIATTSEWLTLNGTGFEDVDSEEIRVLTAFDAPDLCSNVDVVDDSTMRCKLSPSGTPAIGPVRAYVAAGDGANSGPPVTVAVVQRVPLLLPAQGGLGLVGFASFDVGRQALSINGLGFMPGGSGLTAHFYTQSAFGGAACTQVVAPLLFRPTPVETCAQHNTQNSVRFSGYLVGPQNGLVTFLIESSPNATVLINGTEVAVASCQTTSGSFCPGNVGKGQGAISMVKGTYYRIAVLVDNPSDIVWSMSLKWSYGANVFFSSIDTAFLFPDRAPSGLSAPAVPPSGGGLLGRYYAGAFGYERLVCQQVDDTIDFAPSTLATCAGSSVFSVRWSGLVVGPINGSVAFTVVASGAVRMTFDGALLIDHWADEPLSIDVSVDMVLEKRYALVLQFMHGFDEWHVQLKWSYADHPHAPVPASHLLPDVVSDWLVSLNTTTSNTTVGCPVVGLAHSGIICRPDEVDTVALSVRLEHAAAAGLAVAATLVPPVALTRLVATTTTSTTTTTGPSDLDAAQINDGQVVLSVGAVVGIAVGSFAFAGVLAGVLIFVAIRFRRRIFPHVLSHQRSPNPFSEDDLRTLEYERRRRGSTSPDDTADTLRVTQLVSPPSGSTSRSSSMLSPGADRSPGTMSTAASSFGTGEYRRMSNARSKQGSSVESILVQSSSVEHGWEIPYEQLEIGERLGECAYGVVYKATWRFRPCVVKQVKVAGDLNALSAFMREAERMKMLRPHPAVVQMLGVCTDPDTPVCIVTEYVNGGSLQDIMFDEYFESDTVLRAFHDVATGMNHLHNENIIHCDLAARNVLISRQGTEFDCKVADFGLSHFTDTGTYYGEHSVKIPIRWCSPEVIKQRRFSKKSDVWSMGVLMWEVLAKSVPYPDLSVQEVIVKVCDEGYRLRKPTGSYPAELYTSLMLECWSSEVERRPDFASICRRLEAMRSAPEERPHPIVREQSMGYIAAAGSYVDSQEISDVLQRNSSRTIPRVSVG